MRKLKNILVTGGAGFIGSNFIRYSFEMTDFNGRIVNLDKLTYAACLDHLQEMERKYVSNYFFEQGDICDNAKVYKILNKYEIDTIVHFAAESHVDQSIVSPERFVKTNVLGTFILLDCAKKYWKEREDVLFHHISTDEVYGSLGETGYFTEEMAYDPHSPYSASKAGADHFVNAYAHTFNLPTTLSNCSNNYGPYQNIEKLIPLMITNIINEKDLPIYGDGKNVRDWLFVDDHVSAIWHILKKGTLNRKYNIGGDNEWANIELINFLCEKVAQILGKDTDYYKKLLTFVKDRPGHDRRYAIDSSRIKKELNWRQSVSFEQGLEQTVNWYLARYKL
ncbi:MAG: dTDP-glucose 4,6-dehydratase [bacterium]|nr:dTDP-glucose 4,6-dehydratase [bacterium]